MQAASSVSSALQVRSREGKNTDNNLNFFLFVFFDEKEKNGRCWSCTTEVNSMSRLFLVAGAREIKQKKNGKFAEKKDVSYLRMWQVEQPIVEIIRTCIF